MTDVKKIIFIVLMILSNFSVKSQQDAMFSHYMFNTLSVNPGYAGSRDALTVTGLHRSQWVGFNGAPKTQTVTMHTPIIKENIGLGLSVLNDKIGPTNTTSFYVDFAYKIKVNEKANLAFGMKAGFNVRQNELNALNINDQSDIAFYENEQSKFLPNFGFGLYYSTEKYYAGIAIPKLMKNDFRNNSSSGTVDLASEERHYFIIAGTVFEITDEIKFKPTALIKMTSAAPMEIDLTAIFLLNDKFQAGPMFRTGDAFGVLFGVYILDELMFNYSFDWSYGNKTIKYNQGSHEIVLRYDFILKNKAKIRSPRYF